MTSLPLTLRRTSTPAWAAASCWCAKARPKKRAALSRRTAGPTRPPRSISVKSRRSRDDVLPVEIEADCAVEIGSINRGSGLCQTLQNLRAGMAEGIVGADRNDCPARLYGGEQLRRS